MSHPANDIWLENKAELKEEKEYQFETKGRSLGIGGRYGRPLRDYSNIPSGSFPDNQHF